MAVTKKNSNITLILFYLYKLISVSATNLALLPFFSFLWVPGHIFSVILVSTCLFFAFY